MDLEEYVRETLLAIARGVVTAQKDADYGGHVGRVATSERTDAQGNAITMVSFDLATTSEERGSVGGGIKVVPFVAAKGDMSGSQVLANRIQFTLPLAVPKPGAQQAEDEERARRHRDALNQRPRHGGWT